MFLFDDSIISFFHQISLQFPQLSPLIVVISTNSLCKGAVISVLVWWLWFQPSEFSKLIRERLTSTLIISGVSIVLARVSGQTHTFLHNLDGSSDCVKSFSK